MAARIPMMAATISSSMSVNPDSRRRTGVPPPDLPIFGGRRIVTMQRGCHSVRSFRIRYLRLARQGNPPRLRVATLADTAGNRQSPPGLIGRLTPAERAVRDDRGMLARAAGHGHEDVVR